MTPASYITDAVRAYYEIWAREAKRIEGHPNPPDWDDLDGEQMTLWMAVFAATVELSHRSATAILATVDVAPKETR